MLLLLLALAGCHDEPDDQLDDTDQPWEPSAEDVEHWEAWNAVIEGSMEENALVGVAMAVVIDGHLAFTGGLGLDHNRHGDADDNVPDGDTRFWVASMAKMITGAAVVSAADEGALDLQAPVTDVVPWLQLEAPFEASDLTTHMLLTHTAGIPDESIWRCDQDLEQYWRDYDQQYPLWAPPGRLYNYSNPGFSLAGLVLQAATGQPFAEAVEQRVFAPAGMQTATYDTAEVAAGEYATGHTLRPDGTLFAETYPSTWECEGHLPDGYLWASVTDYARFAQVLLGTAGDPELSAVLQQINVGQVSVQWAEGFEYGYGMFVGSYTDYAYFAHPGGFPGFRSFLLAIPEREFAAVVFLNTGHFSPETLVDQAVQIFLDGTGEVGGCDTQPEDWAAWVGTYHEPYAFGDVVITLENESLYGDFEAYGEKVPLPVICGATFAASFSHGNAFEVSFEPDEQGIGEYLVTRAGVAARVPDPPTR